MYSLRDNIRHGAWEEVEEWLVLLGERLYGRDWAKITDLLQTRTHTQVRHSTVPVVRLAVKYPAFISMDVSLVQNNNLN